MFSVLDPGRSMTDLWFWRSERMRRGRRRRRRRRRRRKGEGVVRGWIMDGAGGGGVGGGR